MQWFWFLDTAIGVYFLLKEYASAEVTRHPRLFPSLVPSPPLPRPRHLSCHCCSPPSREVVSGLTSVPGTQIELKRCRKSKDAKGERTAKWRMINAVLDMSKSLTDLPLAVHYGDNDATPKHPSPCLAVHTLPSPCIFPSGVPGTAMCKTHVAGLPSSFGTASLGINAIGWGAEWRFAAGNVKAMAHGP